MAEAEMRTVKQTLLLLSIHLVARRRVADDWRLIDREGRVRHRHASGRDGLLLGINHCCCTFGSKHPRSGIRSVAGSGHCR
jgi:hypothetical protein